MDYDKDKYELHLAAERQKRGLNLSFKNIVFDPSLHHRDLTGKFAKMIGSLQEGQSVSMPDGTTVTKKGEGSGWSGDVGGLVVHRKGSRNGSDASNPRDAATSAIMDSMNSKNPSSIGGSRRYKTGVDHAKSRKIAQDVVAGKRGVPTGDEYTTDELAKHLGVDKKSIAVRLQQEHQGPGSMYGESSRTTLGSKDDVRYAGSGRDATITYKGIEYHKAQGNRTKDTGEAGGKWIAYGPAKKDSSKSPNRATEVDKYGVREADLKDAVRSRGTTSRPKGATHEGSIDIQKNVERAVTSSTDSVPLNEWTFGPNGKITVLGSKFRTVQGPRGYAVELPDGYVQTYAGIGALVADVSRVAEGRKKGYHKAAGK